MNLTDGELREALGTALGVQRWIDEVAARAPFGSFEELERVAYEAATPLSRGEIDEAVSHHPRIGERPTGSGAAAAMSRREQGSVDAEDAEVNAAIAVGNAEYERRFDRVFLIRAAGRTRTEILAELRRRILLDDDTELAIVGEQLRDIAMLRLAAQLGPVTTREGTTGESATREGTTGEDGA